LNLISQGETEKGISIKSADFSLTNIVHCIIGLFVTVPWVTPHHVRGFSTGIRESRTIKNQRRLRHEQKDFVGRLFNHRTCVSRL
jgi:hypothetical protein